MINTETKKLINTIILSNLAEFDKVARKNKMPIKEFFCLEDLLSHNINITAINRSNQEIWKMSLSKALLVASEDKLKELIDNEMHRSWNLFISK